MNGEAEFNETFFSDAITDATNIVGAPGEGWKVAMGTLAFERGVSTLAQQMSFRNELDRLVAAAKANGAAADPTLRLRLAEAYSGLRIMRYSALRMLSSSDGGELSGAAYTYKIHWATWRKKLGELVMDVLGPPGEIAVGAPYHWDELQGVFFSSRSTPSTVARTRFSEISLPSEHSACRRSPAAYDYLSASAGGPHRVHHGRGFRHWQGHGGGLPCRWRAGGGSGFAARSGNGYGQWS
jgi:alkylation response protein AidB-like acyl-CoA dehydrogenase